MFRKAVTSANVHRHIRQQQRTLHNMFEYGNVGVAVLRKKDLEEVHHSDPGHDAEVFKREELFGPGPSSPDKVPHGLEHYTGKQRIEYASALEGKDAYHGMMDPLVIKKKGTRAEPIRIDSPDSDRYVGCVGHPGHQHMQVWFQVTEDGHKYWEFGHNRCSECGNTYKLNRIELEYPSIN